jgi:hypothetical protein
MIAQWEQSTEAAFQVQELTFCSTKGKIEIRKNMKVIDEMICLINLNESFDCWFNKKIWD